MNNKKKIKKVLKIFIIILLLVFILLCSLVLFFTFYNDKTLIDFKLIGDNYITLNVLEKYNEEGYKAIYKEQDISNLVEINSDLDINNVGEYKIEYKINYKNKEEILIRNIKIIDNINPTIKLNGKENITIYLNEQYKESGATANDNYDGDITDKIEIDGIVDNTLEGVYELTYNVLDSSNNKASVKRIVTVKKKPLIHKPGVAVLNYHFFYDTEKGCSSHNCLHVSKFEEQLKYLKDNNYKALTIDEFVNYMYSNLNIPEKSVLITIDDGAMGTSFINGNYLIPLLEKYQLHATLFLITSWWDIKNYQSPYLDVESHSFDMHIENYCKGVSRGAKMLCLSHEEAVEDLKKSIEITGSNNAYCYPFYVYNNETITEVQEAGFKIAFAGGGGKATRNSNKYAIPRFQIKSSMTLNDFIYMIY